MAQEAAEIKKADRRSGRIYFFITFVFRITLWGERNCVFGMQRGWIFMKKVIVAPLNWGLGHATRCIPIIDELLRQGAEVIIASDGEA